VVADSRNQLSGSLHGVLTPHGLFAEARRNKPLLFVPVGSRAEADGSLVVVSLPGHVLTFRFSGVGQPAQLAADTVAFLVGERPVPLPAEYRRPWWLVGVGVVLALGLAVGPVAFAGATGLELWIGLLLGGVFAALTTVMNIGVALFTRISVGGKVALMAGVGVAVLAVFLVGATAYLVGRPHHPEPTPPPVKPLPPEPVAPPPSPPPQPSGPPTHFNLVYQNGKTRLDDGPAEVTALAVAPNDGTVIAGYADGTTQLWSLDQPAFEPPRPGPQADGAVHRIAFDPTGKTVFLSCDGGLVVAPLSAAAKLQAVVPGQYVTVWPAPNRERFGAVRAGRVQVRYTPADLIANPPAGRAVKGFVVSTMKDETLPAGVPAGGVVPAGGAPTFLAWHPTGRLMCGTMNGNIVLFSVGGLQPTTTVREHKAAVRAWAESPWGDFATGDDQGVFGIWLNRSATPMTLRAGRAAISHLAFNPCGGELAVADAAGGLSVWSVNSGKKDFEVKRRGPITALAYGPQEDLLLIADGKGVEVWWLPELAAQAKP
jgi:hypothetical protein